MEVQLRELLPMAVLIRRNRGRIFATLIIDG